MNYEELESLKNKLIETGVFKKDGSFNNLYSLPPNIDLSFIPGDSLKEKIWILFKNNGIRPFCIICGKPTQFISIRSGYRKTCSKECLNKSKALSSEQARSNYLKSKEVIKNKYGVESFGKIPGVVEKRKNTNLKRYGVDNPQKDKTVREKTKQTCILKYGHDNPSKSKEIKNKIKNTSLVRYGEINPSKNEDIKKKISEKNKIIFNSNSDIWNRIRDTNKKRYHVENPMQNQKIKDRLFKSNENKYGVPCVLSISEIQSRIKETNKLRYGSENPLQNESIKRKSRQTCINRYGVPYPSQNYQIKRKIFSHRGMTNPERRMRDFLISQNFEFKYEYEINGKCFDFAIFKDELLNILIEIDGEYSHGLIADSDCRLVNGINDHLRFRKVPDNIKYIVIDSQRVEESFPFINKIYEENYKSWFNNLINSFPSDFPYYNFSRKRLEYGYFNLCRLTDIKKRSIVGMSLINQYHRSIFNREVPGFKSPIESYKYNLKNLILNKYLYYNELSSQSILDGFIGCDISPRYPIGSPSYIRKLLQEKAAENKIIFDPLFNYSEVMLASCSLNKSYYGICKDKDVLEEANSLINDFSLNAFLNKIPSHIDCICSFIPFNFENKTEEIRNRYKANKYIFITSDPFTIEYKIIIL